MTRDEVLDVLEALSPLRRKRLARADVAVHFLPNDRLAVVLPEASYTADERRKLDGKFQNTMTIRRKAHAFLDFAPPEAWKGASTPIGGGFQ